jgi:hypothetical protein
MTSSNSPAKPNSPVSASELVQPLCLNAVPPAVCPARYSVSHAQNPSPVSGARDQMAF